MSERMPRTLGAFERAAWYRRLFWMLRPNALQHARAARVDADVEARVRSWQQLSRTVLVAFGVAGAVAAIDHVRGNGPTLSAWYAVFALVMAQVGALWSIRRSSEIRAYLGEVRALLESLSVRWLLTEAMASQREVESCTTLEELRERATAALARLRSSEFFPKRVDAFSLWVRDDLRRSWRIVAALGCSERTIANFTQPLLERETPGGGVVANLAVTGQSSSYLPSMDDPDSAAVRAWIRDDPDRSQPIETLGVFLLCDESGAPIGAFALTSPVPDALELDRSGGMPPRVDAVIKQCAASLVAVARRAHALVGRG